ncbi:hypothetical protein I79_001890 [Cricetulus griseus]|uniref:Uncharacterized protein n=1 Tax=Cricetulus griseus TaxID=10029 RepID=G3GVY4_CRIGR|nr:hypothetical protein I79_001890 [Cricetulus griseus]
MHLYRWPLLASFTDIETLSHSNKPQLLSINPSCFQSEYHAGNSYTLFSKFYCKLDMQPWSPTRPEILCYHEEILPRRFHFSDAY